jgi:NADP oxidoreductase coenzyme F420-dependent
VDMKLRSESGTLKAPKLAPWAQQFPTAHLLLNGEAAQNGEMIVLATPWQSTEEAVRTCWNLQGKTIIDCTNPLKSDFSGLEVGFSSSGRIYLGMRTWRRCIQGDEPDRSQAYGCMPKPSFPKIPLGIYERANVAALATRSALGRTPV